MYVCHQVHKLYKGITLSIILVLYNNNTCYSIKRAHSFLAWTLVSQTFADQYKQKFDMELFATSEVCNRFFKQIETSQYVWSSVPFSNLVVHIQCLIFYKALALVCSTSFKLYYIFLQYFCGLLQTIHLTKSQ